MKVRATKTAIGKLRPADSRYDVQLENIPNGMLRVKPNGTVQICARYREGRYRRRVLGNWNEKMGGAEIRKLIEAAMPGAYAVVTVEELTKSWLLEHAPKRRTTERTRREAERVLRKVWLPRLGSKLAHEVTRRDIMAVLRPLLAEGKHRSVRAYTSVLSGVFRWAVATAQLDANPCVGLELAELAPKGRRDYLLTPGDVALLWNGLGEVSPASQAVVRAVLVTGARAGELCQLREADVREHEVVLRGATTKTRKERRIPRTPMLDEILASGLVFAGILPNSVGRTITRHLPGFNGRLHDARRLIASYLGPRFPQLVVKRILGHSIGGDITLDHYTVETEDLRARELEARLWWEGRLKQILNKTCGATILRAPIL